MATHSKVVTVTDEYKGESRRVVMQLQQQVETKFEEQLKKAKREVEKCQTEDEIDSFVDSQFDCLDREFLDRSKELREYVKSKKPTKPQSHDAASKAKYDEELSNYRRFVEYSTSIIKRLTQFIMDIFTKIKEFFHSLWNWIKRKFQDITKKVSEFINFMKEKFGDMVNYIFG